MRERATRDHLRGQTALVTGASGGLGAEFARNLARRGCHLVLVARREPQLRSLREEIAGETGVRVEIVPMDLSVPNASHDLHERLRAAGIIVDVLINNAGYGIYGNFVDIPWDREHNMLELDIVALTHLTKLFVRDMVARNFGRVLLVSSIGAYAPSPTYATYSAAKSYVLQFGEALRYELRHTNVGCTVVAPGIVATDFLKVTGQKPSRYQRLVMMSSTQVVEIAIEAMLAGRGSVVPGWINAVTAWSNRLVPRSLSAAIAYRLMTVE